MLPDGVDPAGRGLKQQVGTTKSQVTTGDGAYRGLVQLAGGNARLLDTRTVEVERSD
jgi:hypothetical protein